VSDFLSAIGLVLVIEGTLYALFPERMKQAMIRLSDLESSWLRRIGLGAAVFGVMVVWLVRG
jgi:uncharacterized protein